MSTATGNAVLSTFVQLGLLKEGSLQNKWGSNRVPLQIQGTLSLRKDYFTVEASGGVNIYTRSSASNEEIPAIVLLTTGTNMYVEIKTDTSVGVNENTVWIKLQPNIPFIISGWETTTARSGGLAGKIRSVFAINASGAARDLDIVRVEGPEPTS